MTLHNLINLNELFSLMPYKLISILTSCSDLIASFFIDTAAFKLNMDLRINFSHQQV